MDDYLIYIFRMFLQTCAGLKIIATNKKNRGSLQCYSDKLKSAINDDPTSPALVDERQAELDFITGNVPCINRAIRKAQDTVSPPGETNKEEYA